MPVRNVNELGRSSYTQGGFDFVADRNRLMGAGFGVAPVDLSVGAIRSVTATGTATKADSVIVLAGTGTYTYNLPAAATMAGSTLTFKKTGASGVVTLDGSGSETIDGATTLAITAQQRVVVILSDGTNWLVLSNHTPAAG